MPRGLPGGCFWAAWAAPITLEKTEAAAAPPPPPAAGLPGGVPCDAYATHVKRQVEEEEEEETQEAEASVRRCPAAERLVETARVVRGEGKRERR